MAGLKKMLCLFMAAVLLAAVPFSVFAATNRPAQQLGQNKTKWCWAAALGYAAYWYCSGHQISTGVSEADQLLSSTDGIHSNTIGGTGSTQPYYGSINGSPSAYGLQRAACIYVYGNDQNNISTSSGTTLVNCLNHLGGFSGAEIMKKNGTTWESYQQNAIKGLTAIRAAFCSKVGSSLGHTLLLETYSTSWDQFLVYDPYYMQREWVDADDVFNQNGFSLSWRSDTFVFEVCVYKDF